MLKTSALIAALCLMIVSGVRADTLQVGSAVTGYALQIHDSSVGTVNAAIDPYHGTLNLPSGSLSVLLYCIDPNHWDMSGAYSVTYNPNGIGSGTNQALNGISSLASAQGFSSSAQLYGGLAWLSYQINSLYTTTTAQSKLSQQEYQAAIWALADTTNTFYVVTSPSSNITLADFNTAVSGLEHDAYLHRNDLNGSFTVLTQAGETANCASCAQEYLIFTPEPSGIALLASGMIGLAGLLKRRRA